MVFPLIMKEFALEGFAIIQIDKLRQGSPVQKAIAEGCLDMLTILCQCQASSYRIPACPVKDHDHGHPLRFSGLGIYDIESQSMSICYPDIANLEE